MKITAPSNVSLPEKHKVTVDHPKGRTKASVGTGMNSIRDTCFPGHKLVNTATKSLCRCHLVNDPREDATKTLDDSGKYTGYE